MAYEWVLNLLMFYIAQPSGLEPLSTVLYLSQAVNLDAALGHIGVYLLKINPLSTTSAQ